MIGAAIYVLNTGMEQEATLVAPVTLSSDDRFLSFLHWMEYWMKEHFI